MNTTEWTIFVILSLVNIWLYFYSYKECKNDPDLNPLDSKAFIVALILTLVLSTVVYKI